MVKNLRRSLYLLVTCCVLVYFFRSYLSLAKLQGRWHLYTGSNISSEINIAEKLNSKDYMDISETSIKEYRSDGKDGVSSYKIRGDKLYSGDAIFKFKISNIGNEKVLNLTLIGYNFGHGEDKYIDDGESYMYIFDIDMDSHDL
ncbi:hypothetical protein NSA50_01975 [Clostridium sp. DSM 100503]|uniref:hypothetical protein n=1 Tax=Clostridium sp. DSM 100503 TaxID=2963282 RepID=UPI002149FD41|nr:hypothetical protein [Clostridium sp. DSM 100503]MCR1949825.1 hypothetical protein [Clostridium sp. DSM 100503]